MILTVKLMQDDGSERFCGVMLPPNAESGAVPYYVSIGEVGYAFSHTETVIVSHISIDVQECPVFVRDSRNVKRVLKDLQSLPTFVDASCTAPEAGQ